MCIKKSPYITGGTYMALIPLKWEDSHIYASSAHIEAQILVQQRHLMYLLGIWRFMFISYVHELTDIKILYDF